MSETIAVGSYGVHTHGNIPFLHQDQGEVKDSLGLDIPSPFKVMRNPGTTRPAHIFNLANLEEAQEAYSRVFPHGYDRNNELLKFFLPLPDSDVLIAKVRADLPNVENTLLKLAALQSPAVSPIYWEGPDVALKARASNLLTLIYKPLRFSAKTSNQMDDVIDQFKFGVTRLLLIPPALVPTANYIPDYSLYYGEVKQLVDSSDITSLKLAGCWILHQWMENYATS